ncbi:MAG: hypothetical protein OQK04_01235 [Kangiellaceae bacterium]|nr:hypothetical protein [Kangiellaceae bacterium]MCW8997325.1 hypothetical protein [Kangiellaceae bacterium]
MNYREFLEYSERLSGSLIRLDDLNPYTLTPYFNHIRSESLDVLPTDDYYILRSTGVRPLLRELFKYFTERNYQLNLPNDVYPEYFNLPPANCNLFHYTSYRAQSFAFSTKESNVALVTNPLVPEGRYLTNSELSAIDTWLLENNDRWIIFDNVYDYQLCSLEYEFKSNQIIFVSSLAKVNLSPGSFGWALCKKRLPNFELAHKLEVDQALCLNIQDKYSIAWKSIDDKRILNRSLDWHPPEVGYLSTISENFETLRVEFGIAAIPASVFGIDSKNVSIISCLSEIKDELL